MKDNQYSIGDFSKLSGLSIRTLQYYDDIHLLPSTRNQSGKRTYNEQDLHLLEQIMFYKLLGFPLKEVKNNLEKAEKIEDFQSLIQKQQLLLLQKIEKLNTSFLMLELVEERLNQGEKIDLAFMIQHLEIAPDDDIFTQILNLHQNTTDWNAYKTIKSNDVIHFYHEWKRCLLKANLLIYEEIDYKSNEAQELASDWWEAIIALTNGNRDLINQIAHQNLLNHVSLGHNEAIIAASNFLDNTLETFLKQNHIKKGDNNDI
ncbi:MerR family transcriptional regulator [Facklamia sp. DSM 111018]|uniref:MerR family transcriptional regulator n=1 Tax=Facklamia lactis TaxID=2749967 RepID=A0ABS0LQV1_9LACT|nr:MerR family transcriptional regulator [Facklamia lactis]MBG9980717.1 MerR family transcriptional regulator [Facklamia lactis]MBG9986531.1 MerR family transcriptional regulator [Facklamia lactis]